MKILSLFLLAVCVGSCSRPAQPASTQVEASSPKPSRDELLDPEGNWNEKYKNHQHLTAAPLQLARWKQVDPSVHTWCVGFDAPECEETYGESDYREEVFTNVDPACWESLNGWQGDQTCSGNIATYFEIERAEPLWKQGWKPKPANYTADGHWQCPGGFREHAWSFGVSVNGHQQPVYYVPPKIDCSRYFIWGMWRLSPYRAAAK